MTASHVKYSLESGEEKFSMQKSLFKYKPYDLRERELIWKIRYLNLPSFSKQDITT